MLSSPLVEKIVKYVKKRLIEERSGHDWFHVMRVWKLAVFLHKKEGGNLELIELAALLHSAAERDYKNTPDENIRSLAMSGMLDVLGIEDKLKHEIIEIAQLCRYKGVETQVPTTIEGKIVQDANWLDGLGAVGVARCFTAGGYISRGIHNPEQAPRLIDAKIFKQKKETTSINYFYEKTLQLPNMLNTATAKKLALKRVVYIKKFIEQFMYEWEGNDFEDAEQSEPFGLVLQQEQK